MASHKCGQIKQIERQSGSIRTNAALAFSRRALLAALAALLVPIILACSDVAAQAQDDPLPSWNNGTPKQAIVDFVGAIVAQALHDGATARPA